MVWQAKHGREESFPVPFDTTGEPYVALARYSFENFTRTGRRVTVPDGLPVEMTARRAGAFVSLHEHGELRGCIGTIAATEDNLAEEIISNAIAACSRDPRFPPVEVSELADLVCSVDVLGDAEPCELEDLDPRRYGVIVSNGWSRGLLLPDLEGVDTVMQQVDIARRKAGIGPNEPVRLERFEVVRHE
ncbi:MAG: AmmeMemoRadiSam system protein A [Eggerthellaceae bacterium]|jgi:AmmeMemoRadiSam system protein A